MTDYNKISTKEIDQAIKDQIDETIAHLDYVHNIAYNQAIEDSKKLIKELLGSILYYKSIDGICQQLDALKQKI